MKIDGDLLRGHTDAIILSVIEEADSYGYEINRKVEELSEGAISFTEATLYTSFKRLEAFNFIQSYWVDGPNVKRKYYSITREGIYYLDEYRKKIKIMNKIFEKVLKEDK